MSYLRLPLIFLGITFFCAACSHNRSSTLQEGRESLADSTPADTAIWTNRFYSELDDPERDEWQKPSVVLNQFGPLDGKLIADIGAGTGYFSFRLASKGAHVLAIDIDSNFLEYIEDTALEMGSYFSGSINTRVAPPQSPHLNENEVDGVLIVNTVAFLPTRIDYFKEIFHGLKPGGKLIIVDFKGGRSPVSPSENLQIASGKLMSELKQAGFQRLTVNTESLPYQYIIEAIKP